VSTLRIGTLGTARITPGALLSPAKRLSDVEVVSVAARDPERARAFAARHGIPRTSQSYETLIADPEIDAVYNPLPNGLHGRWTMAAIDAGKHVLCEKPFAADAAEAARVAERAAAAGVVVMEAFHYRYHPLAARLVSIVSSGELGEIRHIEASMCFPLVKRSDIRYRLDLAGGALMDAGCYPVHLVRGLGRGEPTVRAARAKLASPGVDRAMRADLAFEDGATGRIRCSLLSTDVLSVHARVTGAEGELRGLNPFAPQHYHRLSVRTPAGHRVEHLTREPTYDFQLRAFAYAVRYDGPVLTSPADAVANMAVIDAIYTAAGMEPRQPTRAAV
jgi:predicted dehydrogenase